MGFEPTTSSSLIYSDTRIDDSLSLCRAELPRPVESVIGEGFKVDGYFFLRCPTASGN